MPDALVLTGTTDTADIHTAHIDDIDVAFSCDSLSLEEVGITMFLL